MPSPVLLPLLHCTDPVLVGGKAAGLSRLLSAGVAIPPGCCVTTAAYRQALETAGLIPLERWRRALQRSGRDRQRELQECHEMIRGIEITGLTGLVLQAREVLHRQTAEPDSRWAVRSSATCEDMSGASYAGFYRTELGLSWEQIAGGIAAVWASVWDERVMEYMISRDKAATPPEMAVVIQPMLDATVAGVAYSIHPVTGRADHVTINAIRGIGRPLVDGTITPDHYTVETKAGHPLRVVSHMPGRQQERLFLSNDGVATEDVAPEERTQSPLSDQELFEVVVLAKRIEQVLCSPVDVEWAFERERLWVLQARPVTAGQPASELTNDNSEWSRANFKETMPEVPSPMGLSFLEHFMDDHILSHYRRAGCRIPPGVSSVRIVSGRPYLNVSLFHMLVAQLRSNPALNIEQMGGELLRSPPGVEPLRWPAYLRAGWLIGGEMRRALRSGPTWFGEMKGLAIRYSRRRVRDLSLKESIARLDDLEGWLGPREVTFGIAAGVGQCLQAFSRLLPGWLGEDWRSLLNASLQGQGTVISAQQILRVAELVERARTDPAVSLALGQGWKQEAVRPGCDDSPFLSAFSRFIEDFGHRGVGESDVMSPRLADQPEALLEVIKTQLEGPPTPPGDIIGRQQAARDEALGLIKARCGVRLHRWFVFLWWYRRLCRFFSLREANRHHLMWYSLAARNLLLRVGELLVEQGLFTAPQDIFFLTLREREALASNVRKDWTALISSRRADRQRWMTMQVPDTLRTVEPHGQPDSVGPEIEGAFSGIPVSAGRAAGRVTFVRSTADWRRVQRGDIIVAPVIDPGMAPLFGLAGGLIVEMGGTLSHGAIIAREYGLPTITNVRDAMSLLMEGESVVVDAVRGRVSRHTRASGT